jgi:hypothetical protein
MTEMMSHNNNNQGNNRTTTPSLHVLQLHESPFAVVEQKDRFHCQWVLRVMMTTGNSPPSPCCCRPMDAPPHGESDDVKEGDVIFFPELNSGAGEFEGLRWVGPQQPQQQQPQPQQDAMMKGDCFPLLATGGIEHPIFPAVIATAHTTPEELRSKYENLLDQMLQYQGLSMADVLGGADVVEQFWQHPPSQSGRRLTEVKETWMIPLESCKWLGPAKE